jgi:hypothetical protein
VLAHLNQSPSGLDARYVRTTDDGKLDVVGAWASKAHADRFFTETLSARAKVLGPEPAGTP